jgi:hypothetical protein
MPADYDRIRADNLDDYGKATRHLEFFRQLYADRTHFLLELLQNAEDARHDDGTGATDVRFDLYPDRLEVRHDGRPFNEADVRGVCGIGESSKIGDLTKIGRFGVGFKSVHAYTSTPEIHSGDEHFRIVQFIRPESVPVREPGRGGTLFVFPFDFATVPPSQAFAEIEHGLRSLSPRTLLFLRSIRSLVWSIHNDDVQSGGLLREGTRDSESQQITLVSEADGQTHQEDWLVFGRQIAIPDSNLVSWVELAFQLEHGESGDSIVPATNTQLAVWFPTDKETKLGFLLNGPFRTTPARDNVPPEDDWNKFLVSELASLLVDVLFRLQDRGLLSVPLLATLPIVPENFPETSMFFPIFDRVRTALLEQPLLPTGDGDYVPGKNAKVARTSDLRRLVGPDQLAALYPDETVIEIRWLTDEISQDRTPELLAYLKAVLGVDEVTPEGFAARISEAFLGGQSDEWFQTFYEYLGGIPSLWRRPTYARDRAPLAAKPFIRLQNDRLVAPFASDGRPQAYLPPPQDTTHPIVKRTIAESPGALVFLKALGLGEPDIVAEVLEVVLPKYQGGDEVPHPGEREHSEDLQKIRRAFQTARSNPETSRLLTERLKATPFVRARNTGTGQEAYRQPLQVYIRTDEFERYFRDYDQAWFLAEPAPAAGDGVPDLEWRSLGVVPYLRLTRVANPTLLDREKNALHGGNCTRETGITDYVLEGLTPFLKRLSDVQSGIACEPDLQEFGALTLWKLLLGLLRTPPSPKAYQGEFRWFYFSEKSAPFPARFTKQLCATPWLPSRHGGIFRPSELSLRDLPQGFEHNDMLAEILGMRPPEIDRFAQEHGVRAEIVKFALDHASEVEDLMRRRTEEAMAAAAPQAPQAIESKTTPTITVNYRALFADAFDKAGTSAGDQHWVPSGPVPNPAGRAANVQNEIQQNRKNEPDRRERFVRVPTVRWEQKADGVRAFLLAQYGGRCQVCGSTFLKRDGTPYFEGVYLVSHTVAQWLDRPGNVLCLCADCSAKFQHGPIEAEDLARQIETKDVGALSDEGTISVRLRLCHEEATLHFTQRHLIDLQALLKSGDPLGNEASSRAGSSS